MKLYIVWNKRAIVQLDDAIAYIGEMSPLNADKVKKEILFKIDSLVKHPEIYTPDKYKLTNDGSFRAFEIHHYRITYRLRNNQIRILRIRHTKMKPLYY